MRAPRLGLLLALVAAASLRAEEIAFGILGTDSAAALRQNWNPFLADMAKETGLEVRGYFATDYAGLVEAMRFGKPIASAMFVPRCAVVFCPIRDRIGSTSIPPAAAVPSMP